VLAPGPLARSPGVPRTAGAAAASRCVSFCRTSPARCDPRPRPAPFPSLPHDGRHRAELRGQSPGPVREVPSVTATDAGGGHDFPNEGRRAGGARVAPTAVLEPIGQAHQGCGCAGGGPRCAARQGGGPSRGRRPRQFRPWQTCRAWPGRRASTWPLSPPCPIPEARGGFFYISLWFSWLQGGGRRIGR